MVCYESPLRTRLISSAGTSHETLQVNKTSLPIELLMHIVSYIKDRKDLMSVELTSRIFRSVALPLIYQTIVISENGRQSLDYQRQTLLYRSLQSSPALDTVTTVDLYLAKWKTCSKAMAPTSNSIKRCNCNRLDRLLGEALSCLPNLESLSLKCNLCWSKASDQRHRHLAHLKTTKLRELWLRCRCSEWNHTYELTADILSSPGMSSLISLWLEWSIAGAMTLPVSLYKDLFANPGNLPSISWLYHDGSMLSDMVITERPITRLAYYPIHSEHSLNLQPLLGQCGNNLTHLFIDNVLSWLPAHIKANPGVYTRLRYVGSLRFKEDSVRGHNLLELLAITYPLNLNRPTKSSLKCNLFQPCPIFRGS